MFFYIIILILENLTNSNDINSTKLYWKQNLKDNIFSTINKKYNLKDLWKWVWNKSEIQRIINNDDLKQRWLDFWDILRLSWYFGDIKKITKLNIEQNIEWIYKVIIESDEFDELETHIELCNNAIKIDWMKINKFVANSGIWTKYVVNLIYFAKEKWFKEVYTTAAKMVGLDKKYKNKWYFFFPKLWFLPSENDSKDKKIINKIKKNPDFYNVESVNELLLLEDEEGNRIWLDFWKEIWNSIYVEFDLSNDSKSMEILRKYLVWKMQS